MPLLYTGYRFFFYNLEKELPIFLFQLQWLISQERRSEKPEVGTLSQRTSFAQEELDYLEIFFFFFFFTLSTRIRARR